MPQVTFTCPKCRYRYDYWSDGQTQPACPQCRYDPIGSLQRAGTAELLSLLRHTDRTTRNNAAVALGERGAIEAAEPLLQMLKRQGAEVETGVVVALGLLRERRAVDELIDLVFEGKDSFQTPPPRASWDRWYYIEALLRIGTDKSLEAVLATNPHELPISALRALAQFNHPKLVQTLATVALVKGVDGYDPEKVVAVINLLGDLRDDLAAAALKTKVLSRNQSIVTAASQGLAKLGFAEPFAKEELNSAEQWCQNEFQAEAERAYEARKKFWHNYEAGPERKQLLDARLKRKEADKLRHDAELLRKQRKDEEMRERVKKELEETRRKQKKCIVCGKPLGLFQRLWGRERHGACSNVRR
jgi:HEAT repeat protein